MNGNELQNQAKYIWDRLDDLAANDPEGYKKFIDQQMEERETFMAPPEARLCFLVKTEENDLVYVNVCAWKRIPYPQDDSEPLKLMCGFVQKHQSKKGEPRHITIPVAANEQVLDEILKSNFDKHELINLIIDLITKQCKLNLCKKYDLCKYIYKGDLPANPRSLFIKNPNAEFQQAELMKMASQNPSDILSSPETLLKNLNLDEDAAQEQTPMPEVDFMKSFAKTNEKPKTKLIEEIGKEPATPEHSLKEIATSDGEKELLLTINLPQINTTADCDLLISRKKIELMVPEKYKLNIPLPKPVNDGEARAKFSKKTKQLTISMPIL
uniref:PIH1 domain-containing protein 2-like n=1 Tax=Phallusia mammillata TaxID=59560 RepID=A0A6F9DPG3_9ASCI|nr:PIH1 domain-containing protein 2-like [Phallusia mammillata]